MAPFHEISAYIAEPLPHDLSNHVDRATGWHSSTIAAMNAFNRLGAPFRLPVAAKP